MADAKRKARRSAKLSGRPKGGKGGKVYNPTGGCRETTQNEGLWAEAKAAPWCNLPQEAAWFGRQRNLGNTRFPGSPLPLLSA